MINCDCSIDVCGEDIPIIDNIKIRKARKEHKCVECDEVIKIGEKYQSANNLYRGDGWIKFATCLPCATIREDFCCTGFYYGELADHLWDCLGFSHLSNPEDWGEDEETN